MSRLIDSLFDDRERRPQTVSELNAQIKSALERSFSHVWIEAEIVNFVAAASGHWYFNLSDGDSTIKAACFKGSNWKIRFKPFDGLKVRVRGKITVYQPKGEYQILVDALEPHGEGALKIAFDQIKNKLAAEGLFDAKLKRELPYFPRRVGVVTSPNGAAFHDILNVLGRRTRTVSIVLIPTRVQGENSGEEIRMAVELANLHNKTAAEKDKLDVLIVGRGGGSAEDLWAFNEERLARAIRASSIPVISAVGHEIDWTIADLVADRRAPTPSAAAEIVAESEESIEGFIEQSRRDLYRIMETKLMRANSRLRELRLAPVFASFPQELRAQRRALAEQTVHLRDILRARLRMAGERVGSVRARLSPVRLAAGIGAKKTRLAVLAEQRDAAIHRKLAARGERLKRGVAQLDALSPLKVLGRGYAITTDSKGHVLASVAKVRQKDRVQIRLSDGRLNAEVLGTEKE